MVHEAIEAKLSDYFEPAHFEVINESYMHNVPEGSESHFKVIIVSEKFTGQRLIGRHRQVNQVLADELANHIHALSIHTYTTEEWNKQNQVAPDSPMCLGGSK
ncbi:transcriptional regulator BolA [Vibrio aquimaris]|uniref:DNA-binding transcriptional regulator BolA n=1 Tax=Vibrio aquimaris TaxID=2587862 RepID=A0A5P9CMU0_9VIBR|nr:transcriptional regulator BolA [Vibrio aquimaris]QFT27047.1 transcriptional regulator BolA [Vibrio aquimaris]